LLLGAAYGVLEEGLMVCSFFNPKWMDLGQLGIYGRWLGVNWVWAEMLIIFHSVYSITVSVALVELTFPKRSNESWVSKKMFWVVSALLAGVSIFGFFAFSSLLNYWTPLPQYFFAIALMVAFGYTAYKLLSNWGQNGTKPLPRLLALWGAGTIGTFMFFFGFWLLPNAIPLWPVGMLFGPFLVYIYVKFLKRYEWTAHAIMHKFALVSGALTFFIVFAPLQELDKSRLDNTAGMTFVGLAFLIGLLLLRRRIKKQMQNIKEAEATKQEIAETKPT
jgi:hypothetical protein